MPASFTTRQLAVIASAMKTVYWLFRVTDNLGTEYHWSTGTVVAGTGSLNVGAQESPDIWTDSEWDTAHTFKIVNFSGITLRRSKSEYGINAPNDVSFSIVNSSNTLTATNFKGGIVRIALVVDDNSGKQVIGSWRFVIKSASPYNQQIDVTCEDFLQQYLRGTYPNTRLISEIFPANTDNKIINDNVCVPEPYGTAYIPLRSIYVGSARYYLLGPSTDKTYTIAEVRNPRATGTKITWLASSFAMTQSTQAAPDTSNWRVFKPIIAASTGGGVVDSPGLWLNGDTFWDIPTKFSEAGTVSVTNPADILRRVLLNMGVSDKDLNGTSFDTAHTTFASWGLAWNFAFYYKEDRARVLSKLLAMCHCCLVIGERISLQVLSAVTVKAITAVEVIKPDETGPSSFRYTDSLAEKVSDSGYVAWQQTGESQDLFLKAKVPAKSATDYPDSETIELPGVQDSQKIQKLGTLYYQRKLLKSADVSANLKGTCLIVRPDDVITINYADFGGTYNVLVDEVTIKPDCSMDTRAIKFSVVLDDWADLAPAAITVATDSTTNSYSPVIAGPDSPGSTNLPNALPGRLRIGQTSNYILLDPVDPLRISLYIADVERARLGNLNGYLDYVTNLYGQAIGDSSQYMKYDPTNGLRISGALSAGTISIGTSPNWFKVDSSGNIWLGQDTLVNAQANTFAVTNAGVLYAITGYIGGATNGWQITAGLLTAVGTGIIQTSVTASTGIKIDSTSLRGYNGSVQTVNIAANGSGWFGLTATKAIEWTTAGAVTIAGWAISASRISNTNIFIDQAGSYISMGATPPTSYGNNVGAWLGYSTTAKLSLYADASNYFQWNGALLTWKSANSALDASGNITATGGTIGGFTLSSTALYAGSIATRIQLDTTSGIHLGATLFADAPFSVTLAGALTTTSATITGVINATSGKIGTVTDYWSIGATGITAISASTDVIINYGKTDFTNVQTGFILGYDFSASAAKFYIGDATKYLNWDGSALTYTKGTLVETIIQMYTNVASLKTSATAGDGSVNSAGVVVTYEGIFGCGANQTATAAAANANVRILATGSTTITGTINATAGYFGDSATRVAVEAAGINVGNTGSIRGGQTAYATGTGFWLGYSGVYKFSIGSPTDYFKWDGTNISLLSSATNAIVIDAGSNILLQYGGNLKLISISAPIACVATLVTTEIGNLSNGIYSYKITFVTSNGETDAGIVSNNVTVDATHKQVDLTGIPISSSIAVTARKIYRRPANGGNHQYLATISNNTTTIYTDNIADTSLGYTIEGKENNSSGKILIDGIEIIGIGSNNVFIGYNTIKLANVGARLVAVGANALYSNTSGIDNIAVGANALYSNTSGISNVSMGTDTLYSNIVGKNNTAIGYYSLRGNLGNYCTAIGYYSLFSNTTGIGNSGVGYFAGGTLTTGTYNLFLGYSAGYSGSQKVDATNSIAIGYNTLTTASNQVVLGNTSITETRLQGNILIGITAAGTSAAKVIGIGNGIAPSTSPADIGQLWSEDINGAGGYAGLHMMVETNAVKLIIPGVYIKGTTGQIANPFEGLIEINTFDNTLKLYADAGWRSLSTW